MGRKKLQPEQNQHSTTPEPSSSFLFPFKRIVIKIGSNLFLEKKTNQLKEQWIESFVKTVANLQSTGIEIVLVCSGAIRLGQGLLKNAAVDRNLDDKQAAAAIGQIQLIHIFRNAFTKHNIPIAQILLTLEDTEVRRRHLNARATIFSLLRNGVIPIINENDTVATTEIRSGDNDRLSARVAQVISADHLLLLSSKINGLYTEDPKKQEMAPLIPNIDEDNTEILSKIKYANKNSNNGIISKIEAAELATEWGSTVIISNALNINALQMLLIDNTKEKTIFTPNITPYEARKKWIGSHLLSSGSLVISVTGQDFLEKGEGLLPRHVLSINGIFQRGELVSIVNQSGQEIGRGLSAYCWKDAIRIRGTEGVNILEKLGFGGREEIIHPDDLLLCIKNINHEKPSSYSHYYGT